jgi:hypothetical protein
MLKHAMLLAPALAAGLMIPSLSSSLFGAVPKVPEKVDKALRTRVNEFFQDHVDGTFRKAMDLVADETKDEYFASGKMALKSFTLDDVKYSDKFDKATVTCTVVRDWEIRMQHNQVTIPMVTTWKIEHGKWVWYHDKQNEWLTPMGPSDYKAITRNSDGTLTVPKINQDSVLAAAKHILDSGSKTNGVDKLDINFDEGRTTDEVHFRNGAEGAVQLEMTPMDPVPGLTFAFDKMNVNAGETVKLSFKYEPQEKAPPQEVLVRFTVIPFNVTYIVTVHFPSPPAGQ